MPVRKLQPGLSFDAGQVVPQLFGCMASQSPTFDDTFWQRWGQLGSPNDQSFTITANTEKITNGSPEATVDVLLMALNGELNALIQDLNPHAMQKALGTDIPMEVTYNSSWQSGNGSTVQASTTAKVINVATGHGAGLVKNDILEIAMSSGNNAYVQFGIVDSVTTDAVTLKYELEAIPPTSGTVKKVDTIIIHHGGSDVQQVALLFQLDFPKRYQHSMLTYRAQASGGVTRQLSGAVKTPSKFEMLSILKTISAKDYLTLASTRMKMPNAA
jgi:hypothetical protein